MKARLELAIVILTIAGICWILVLNNAHSSFENYYSFRGCVELIEKTDTAALCKTASKGIIKIVQIRGKWYLEGDGPGKW